METDINVRVAKMSHKLLKDLSDKEGRTLKKQFHKVVTYYLAKVK